MTQSFNRIKKREANYFTFHSKYEDNPMPLLYSVFTSSWFVMVKCLQLTRIVCQNVDKYLLLADWLFLLQFCVVFGFMGVSFIKICTSDTFQLLGQLFLITNVSRFQEQITVSKRSSILYFLQSYIFTYAFIDQQLTFTWVYALTWHVWKHIYFPLKLPFLLHTLVDLFLYLHYHLFPVPCWPSLHYFSFLYLIVRWYYWNGFSLVHRIIYWFLTLFPVLDYCCIQNILT